MPDDTQLEILIKIKEDIEGLRKAQTALDAVKNSAANLGVQGEKSAVSTKNLHRANMVLAGVLSGNVTGAINGVRGALVSMLGPIGLAVAAATTLAVKLLSMWREQKAAEAAREADEYAWSLARASENAEDLARKSTEAFAAAITNARRYYEETSAALEQQFQSMQKIGRARLALEITKARNDPTLTAQEKILKEHQLLANFEAATLKEKEELLKQQRDLAAQAKANAEKEKEAAQIALDAAKSKPREAWINREEIAKLEALKEQIKTDIVNSNASNIALRTATHGGGRSEEQIARSEALKAQLKQIEMQLKHEQDAATVEERRKDTIATLATNLVAAKNNADLTATALASVNQRLGELETTEKEVAKIENENRDRNANAKAGEAELKAAQEKLAAAQRLASVQEKMQLDQIRFERDQANNNTLLTKAQKQEIINGLLAKERDLLAEMVARRRQLLALETDPLKKTQIEAEIQSLANQGVTAGAGARGNLRRIDQQREDAFNRKEDPYADPNHMTAGEGVEAGIYDAADQLGSVGENISDLFSGTILDSVNAISEGIYGWITGTESFGDVLRNLGDSIFKEMLNTIIRIGAQWLINTILVKTGIITIGATQDIQRTQQTTKTVASNAQVAASAAPGAAATGISSFGTALIFGALALALILAAAGAFATGGPVGGKKQLAWLNDGDDGPEYVIKGASRAKYGDTMLSQINAGTFDPAPYADDALAGISSPVSPGAQLAQAAGNAPASAGQGLAGAIAEAMPQPEQTSRPVYVCFGEDEVRSRIINSGELNAEIHRIVRDERRLNS